MLVLTRREKERIVFPEVDITIELISLSGNRAKVGIAAPEGIRVLREEVAKRAAEFQPVAKLAAPEQKLSHSFRNKLHGITIAAGLLRKQLDRGMVDAAEVTAESLQKQLSELNQASNEKPQPPAVKAKAKRLALVVDDDDNERHLLAGFLRMTGFDVATAGDGADALDYLASHTKPDVVLLDMLMPRCDGASTVRAIRNSDSYQDLKVFAISGTSPDCLGIETGPKGINRWFQKPCDPEQLVQEIQRDLLPAM